MNDRPMLRKRPARQPAGLNQQQRAAVEVPSGPLLVLAGAGTGKTRVVTHRIARLVSHGTAADRILAVTFTNKAAQEMLQRVAQLLPRRTKSKPLVSTFHSLCVRILRRHITALGYPANFAICAAGDQHSLARQVLKEIRVPEATLTPAQLVHRISAWKSRGIRPAAAMSHADSDRDHLAAAAYRRYQRALKSAAAVDFDDLLLLTVDLLDSAAEVQRQEAGRFDHLLVDEYQDTNALQYRIVRHLAGEHRNLCVVGDDDQSIYGWRGAEVDHILRFVRDWPGAIVVRLEDNYRSTAAILAMANRLIEFNKQRHGKTLRATGPGGLPPRILQFEDGESEAVQIVDDISRRIAAGTKPRDIAILFRTGEQSRPFEAALRRNGVRYVLVGGLSFFDRREVKDTLAYLRLLVNPDDDTALLRVINTPPRGIGVKVAERLIAASLDRQCSVWQVIRDPDQLPPMTSTGRRGLERLAEGLDKFNSLGHGTVQKTLADATRRYIESVGYLQHLQTSSDDPDEAATRTSGVEQVISALGEFAAQNRGGTLAEFLDQMTLGDRLPDDERERELQQNGVLLMTLHAAKGLEFPEVYLVGLEEGLLPHHRSIADGGLGIDEERRLCYVGITRAQRRLTISMALSRMKWGKPHATNPSRFLYEMTGQAEHPKYAAAIGPGNG